MIVVVSGVSGSGKSTVGRALAARLGWAFLDGDDLHSARNRAKMSAGQPLSDSDRRPWLRAVAGWMDARIAAEESAVIACSALKRSYRDLLRARRPEARLVFLDITRDLAAARLARRRGHFFGPDLLGSQFADVEPPQRSEPALVVSAASSPAEAVREITRRLGIADADQTG